MNGARGTLVAVPPFVPAVPDASGFHSRKASGIPARPRASSILAQGKAALAAAALG